ncbi:glycoside hydrolase family 31 protein [Cryobacterium sp. 1639]|uniref:glycoside hydrolase family 31 protein n=1 Tax=Cryobacterium inferilacus TaxID=2866629 RepID=UPI001C7317CD|nr:glycoside hydrolase family 31 protein [Cryobacterium sp. 1639]MBX0300540.1 glycoside hydrolase family 31 protein [Cryobacterium sp. 1639]
MTISSTTPAFPAAAVSAAAAVPAPVRPTLPVAPHAHPAAVVTGPNYRFTVLTSRLIRMEYSQQNRFEDRASQLVLSREFDLPQFRVIDHGSHLQIITAHLQLSYDKLPFTPNGLSVQVTGNLSDHKSMWRFGEPAADLGGTARTLDDIDGPVPLQPGLMSRHGFSVVDDSASLVFDDDGGLEPRSGTGTDLYFFGYGRSYRDCLADFYALTGPTPLLPRFALGNWWSRFHRYSDADYRELFERFESERLPFSVAVVDMDWHTVDIDPKYGSGWTGYSWNTELFPDPDEFMAWLHERGLKLTLNVHPADGVQAHEDAYASMARRLGVDTENEDPIVFDITDPAFLSAYFECLHHPLEERGVDFWWLDWQSGPHSRVAGLDPLWMLNHFHFLDSARAGNRPMTFSRYAGLGSHRYPIGFSGDSIVSWESLDFQPYFTATAANVGYGWWSHDIGGHMGGVKDDDLAVRWTQFGVFSPIMRLHSQGNPFSGKEPWNFRADSAAVMSDHLRLRHQLVPYLYSMNYLASGQARPLVQPLYYDYPEEDGAYRARNQYLFGSQLMVCPITQPMNSALGVAKVTAWLPEGSWIDFFTGLRYRGGRELHLYRGQESIPVLARAGAIVPLVPVTDVGNATENPAGLQVRIFPGADGVFDLLEDDGSGSLVDEPAWARTTMEFTAASGTFTIRPTVGNLACVPTERDFSLGFVGVTATDTVDVRAGGLPVTYTTEYSALSRTLTVSVQRVPGAGGLVVRFDGGLATAGNDVTGLSRALLTDAQIEFDLKARLQRTIAQATHPALLIGQLQTMDLAPDLLGALSEIILADPLHPQD